MEESPNDYDWMLRAKCRGATPSEFFRPTAWASSSPSASAATARSAVECLEYALKFRIEHGVWGGASERERRRILRRRRQLNPT